MTIESTNDNNSTNTAITYSECYAQVFLGDCLELYKNIEPKSIDLILTDLPYGTTACKWDTIIPFDKLWEMVNYLLKPNGTFITTASQPFTSALVMSNPNMFRYDIIWNKISKTGHFEAKNKPMKQHEDILVFSLGKYSNGCKNKMTYNPIGVSKGTRINSKNRISAGYLMDTPRPSHKEIHIYHGSNYPTSIISISNANRTNTVHPTQKPIELMQYLLKTYSNENMTIFDPCMGSGTTGIACKNLNRNFIGIEKDEAYFKIAEQRINARTLFS